MANSIYLVVVQDTVVQVTGYLVRAESKEFAEATVEAGMYIEETAAEVVDTLESTVVDIVQIDPEAKGQERNSK
jgi:hypothetical protein